MNNNMQEFERIQQETNQYANTQTWQNPYDSQSVPNTNVRETAMAAAFPALMRKVYVWMTLALAISGLAAYYVATTPSLVHTIFSSQMIFWGIAIAEIALVIGLSAAINKMSFPVAATLFAVYAILNGVLLSSIFLAYSASSITTTFFVTAGTFAAMAVIGSITKTDLTKLGSILLMALIGIIIASIVNIFLKNTMMDLIISAIGVLVFVGLTAYDAQKIKNLFLEYGHEVNDTTQKIALLGALSLYLDFINLFLYLLRFLGRSRE